MESNLPRSLSQVPPPPFQTGQRIIVVGDEKCEDCLRVKEFLTSQKQDFEYHDIDQDSTARDWLRKFTSIVPVLILKDQVLLYEPTDEELAQKLELDDRDQPVANLPGSNNDLYDVIVIGGGPAGVAAAVYSARKQMKTLLLTDSFGGQSIVSGNIHNWIGEKEISGLDLAKKLEAHVRAYPEMVEIKEGERATRVESYASQEKRACDFEVTTGKSSYRGKTVIVASGARRRRLGVPGEDKFEGRGISFCSTCDAPLFKDKKVVVIGGGNAGLEAVIDLFPYASEIYLMEAGDFLKGDSATIEQIKKNPKLTEVILNAQITEVIGEGMVSGIKYKVSGQEKTLEVEGVFVEIGSIPNSEMVKDLVQVDEHGQIMINFQFARTSHPGIFAAGDVTNDPYKQNNISVGDGVRAALSAYNYLQNREKRSPAEERHDIS